MTKQRLIEIIQSLPDTACIEIRHTVPELTSIEYRPTYRWRVTDIVDSSTHKCNLQISIDYAEKQVTTYGPLHERIRQTGNSNYPTALLAKDGTT